MPIQKFFHEMNQTSASDVPIVQQVNLDQVDPLVASVVLDKQQEALELDQKVAILSKKTIIHLPIVSLLVAVGSINCSVGIINAAHGRPIPVETFLNLTLLSLVALNGIISGLKWVKIATLNAKRAQAWKDAFEFIASNSGNEKIIDRTPPLQP